MYDKSLFILPPPQIIRTIPKMKVFLHYEDNKDTALHKSLKITLPKSWKTGPSSKLLDQFVETYNGNEALGASNPLDASSLHLALKDADHSFRMIASDATVVDDIPDRADVYIRHGPSQTKQDMATAERQAQEALQAAKKDSVACTHFGCRNRFPKDGPFPECRYHQAPPVFHETAKFWSCCPQKKAYDWEDFQNIPGCMTGICTAVKESAEGSKQFLGGTDLREQAGEGAQLKSIDDFNKSQAAGGSAAAPVLERLAGVLEELGIEHELFQQVTNGIREEKIKSGITADEAELLDHVKEELGAKLKAAVKAIAVDQLRIK